MRTCLLVFIFFMFGLNTIIKAQNGSVGQPFTSLGQAQNVASDGVYYFSLSGTTFSTYVRVGGWVQVAIDFRPNGGNLPQSNALNNTVRGILTPAALSTLGSATVTRVLTSNGQLDVQNTRPGIITRIVNNQTLLATPADNTDNNTNWTGTNTVAGQFINYGNTTAYGLNQNIFHAGNNGDGIHWIPYFTLHMINNNVGQIPNGAYFQLMVRAPMVAVVSGPVINTQPSTSAQSVCLNAAINALSVSATSPNGSAITYQWYSNASASNAGGTSIGGATSSSYTPPNNVVGTVYYYVICTNNQGSSTSNVSGSITVNSLPQAASNSGTTVDYLVVGGGGGGGQEGGGGGGGGQVITGSVSLLSGSFAVTIGNGGAGATTISTAAANGGTTTLSLPTPVVSIGGGGGGSKNAQGASGGNGGGGGHPGFSGGAGAAGGFAGGTANNEIGGGGAGAGAVGTSASNSNGGIGVSSSISGSATFYGGGGGGGSWQVGIGPGQGGQGGGGSGGTALSPLATSGAANTGGGGGGSGNSQSTAVAKNGGSGIVIVRYLGSPSGTGGTITQVGGYTIHTFNSNGTFAFNNPSTAVVPNVTVCGLTSATFTGTVAAGSTLDWYDAPTNGNLLSQGTLTYTTPALASTTTYYVAVRRVSSGCVSATRTAVTATVNATSFTSTTGASLCSTGTATLQAATAAGTINWYAAITGGASLGTGTSYTTPSISATTTYYAEVTNNGCTTNPRVAVVASVNSTPPTPTITQSGCGVLSLGNYGGGNALDFGQYNSSSYITISPSLNTVFNTNNVTLEGWFKFDPNNVGFPMLIGEAYVGDLKITFAMHKQGNNINAGFYNNGWTVVTSASTIQYNTWMHIAATYDQTSIKIYINGNLDATLNANAALPTGSESWYIGKRWDSNDFYRGVMDEIRIWNVARTQAQIQASMNTTVPTNATGLRAYYKLDESAGTSPADATGNGYNGTLTNGSTWQVPSTSILGASQATFLWSPGGQTTNTITAATSGTYSLVATLSGCQSASVSSSVVLGVTASSNQTICSGTSPANLTLTGTAATIQWQSSTDNVNFTNIGGATSATLSSAQMGNLNATTYYRAYATSAVCAPSYSNTVTITIIPLPTFTSTTGASRCGTGTVTLQAATAAGTINWYAALTGGASLGTGTSFNTPSIAATTTYYADVTNNGCTSSPRTAVVATVNPIPTFSSTTGASICGTGTATLQAATAAGTINWYAALTGGASLGTGTSYTTPSIATTTTYYVDVTDNGCTSSPRTAVVATVNALPPAVNNPTSYTADVLVVGGGGSGGYRHAGGGGGGGVVYQTNFVINAGNIPVTIGNGGVGNSVNSVTGQNSIFSSITAFGGGGGSDNLSVGKNGGSGGGGSNGSFGGSGVAGQGFKGGDQNNGWGCCYGFGAGGGGAGAAGANTNGAAGSAGGIGLPFSISGTSVYYGGGGGGGSSDPNSLAGGIGGGGNGGTSSSVTGNAGTPNTGGGGGGGGASGGTSGIGGNGGSGIVIIRYAGTPAATGGTITQVGGFTIHTFTSNGTFALAGGASASVPNVTSCGAAAVTFTGTVNAGFTLDWYDAANGGNLLSQGTSTYTTPVISTTTTYYVAVRNTTTGCVSATRTAVTATVNIASFTSTTGASRCGTGTVTLQAATAAGTINWYAALTGGASLGTGTSYTTPSIAATTTYYADVTNNGCTSSPRTAVVATVNAIPTFSSTTGASICGTGTATLQAATAAGTINWYAALTGGASLGTGTSYTTPSIATTTTYYADVTNNGCTSSPRTAVVATVNAIPTLSSTTGASRCGTGTVTLQAATAAGTINWYAALTGGASLGTGTSYTTPSIAATTTYYADVTNNGCTSSPRTAVVATVNAIPTFSSTTGASICGTGTATLQAATAAGTINWYAALTGGASLGTGTSYTTPSIAATTTYYADVTNNGCTSSPRTAVVATVNAIPTITSTTGASICVSGTGTLQAATAAGTINWYAALTGGASLGTGTSYTTPSIATTTTYYADVTNNGCTSSPRTSIVATVIPSSTASSSQTVCPGLLPSAITLTNYGGTLQWQTSNDNVTFTNIAGQTSATLPANAIGIMAGTKYIRAMVTNGACVTPSNVVTLSPANVNVLTPLTASSYVWNGQSSSDWGTLSNWYSYNGSSLVPAVTLPNQTSHTVIPANTGCILTQPILSSGSVNVNSLVLEPGSQLTQSGGTFWVWTNLIKNGNLTSTGGFIVFFGPNAGTISGNGTIQFAKMRVNKSAGATLTLQIPVSVSDSLHMWQGNIYTTANNLLTLGLSSALPGTLNYNSGTIVGPFKRFFANSATSGLAGRFPVGTATYNRYAQFSFASSPGVDQSLTVQYVTGTPNQSGSPLYNGLPLNASGSLIQNYSADGYWSVVPTNNNYTAPITLVNYDVSLLANNLTGMQTPQICRLIKSSGSNTAAQNHVAWSACGTHTTIPGGANPTSFVITSTGSQGFSWFNIGTPNSQALPVEFLEMTTACEEEVVRIQWKTATEHNNDYFRIEKSNTGYDWTLLGYKDAVGNSNAEQTYSYNDDNQRVKNYYRLYQVDMDGSEELLSTLYSDCETMENAFGAYPNPSHDSFSIFWKQFKSTGNAQIIIRDINGKVKYKEQVKLNIGANLYFIKDVFAPGVYTIELIDENYERRLIKHVVN